MVQVQNFKDDFQTRGFFKEAGGNQESVEILNQSTDKCDKSHEAVIVEPSMNSTQPTSEEVDKLKGVEKLNDKGGMKKAKVWGPVKPQRRSQRNIRDDKTMLEKAQDLKRKYDLEDNKGNKHISCSSLLSVATEIGLVVEESNPQSRNLLASILALEKSRNEAGTSSCHNTSCSDSTGNLASEDRVSGQGGTPGAPKNHKHEDRDGDDLEKGWTRVGPKKKNKKKK